MRIADIGLRRAMIVTPVNVLHNWRQEFIKWKPIELKALRVFMMDDVPRFAINVYILYRESMDHGSSFIYV